MNFPGEIWCPIAGNRYWDDGLRFGRSPRAKFQNSETWEDRFAVRFVDGFLSG